MIRPNQHQTPLPLAVARDTRVSFQAVGVLARILATPDVNRQSLAALSPREGRIAAGLAVDELEAAGYFKRAMFSGPKGQWTTTLVVRITPDYEPDGRLA